MSDTAACASNIEQIVKTHGRLDVLVNNAGVAVDGLVMRVKDEDWDKQLDTNLKGAFALIRAASRPMMKARGGAIINLTSIVGESGNGGQAAYSASKGGVVGMTLPIARDLAAVGIRVNTILPGFIDTPIYGSGEGAEGFKAKLAPNLLFPQRFGHSEEFASLATELITNSYMNAESIRCDGGVRMPPK